MTAPATRLATQRYPDGSADWIEIAPNNVLWWKAVDCGCGAEAGFMVDVDFVAGFFAECGRQFDASRLPAGVITNPYEVYLP